VNKGGENIPDRWWQGGAQLQVFHRTEGGIRRSSELHFAEAEPGQDERAFGTLEPVWNFIDLTPNGRPTGRSASTTTVRRGQSRG
jgi:predicted dithiol-disulfide oxidoreductase (DUF899 family)